ncbi:GLABROUS1 enhancer-binding protein-like isoform X2 [Papaver somniferum]|uniref:GLABROUS1 enhancer-binding protein-like isoform X2 n=1 Tax=Papaver somniferum TaxID=3469 RepID=UPI000E6FCED0|nr:GLABROUS1 enhancer-binding protein-like isoform X2 [Papaver somniferum]
MASTPDLTPSSAEPNKQIPIKTAARKLPVKRKTADGDNNNNPDLSPMQDPNPNLAITLHENKSSPSPLKFHRIWSDSDEIQLLQGLIDSTKMGLIFPRDLGLLQFSKGSMSKSYTKNQLYEKHRRLREKFRVISERITRGLDFSLLNSHDQSLFTLSKQLWDTSSSSSPLVPSNTKKIKLESGVKVTASAILSPSPQNENIAAKAEDGGDDDDGIETNSDDNNLESGHEEKLNVPSVVESELGKMVTKTVLDVFDRSLEEVRMGLVGRGLVDPEPNSSTNTTDDKASAGSSRQERAAALMIRCQEQRVAEFDVLARRLRMYADYREIRSKE